MSHGAQSPNKREWIIWPDLDEIDRDQVVAELLQALGYAERLGFATTFSPIRVKARSGNFYTGGFVFRAFSVPALSQDEYERMRFPDPEDLEREIAFAMESPEEPEEPEPAVPETPPPPPTEPEPALPEEPEPSEPDESSMPAAA